MSLSGEKTVIIGEKNVIIGEKNVIIGLDPIISISVRDCRIKSGNDIKLSTAMT